MPRDGQFKAMKIFREALVRLFDMWDKEEQTYFTGRRQIAYIHSEDWLKGEMSRIDTELPNRPETKYIYRLIHSRGVNRLFCKIKFNAMRGLRIERNMSYQLLSPFSVTAPLEPIRRPLLTFAATSHDEASILTCTRAPS